MVHSIEHEVQALIAKTGVVQHAGLQDAIALAENVCSELLATNFAHTIPLYTIDCRQSQEGQRVIGFKCFCQWLDCLWCNLIAGKVQLDQTFRAKQNLGELNNSFISQLVLTQVYTGNLVHVVSTLIFDQMHKCSAKVESQVHFPQNYFPIDTDHLHLFFEFAVLWLHCLEIEIAIFASIFINHLLLFGRKDWDSIFVGFGYSDGMGGFVFYHLRYR